MILGMVRFLQLAYQNHLLQQFRVKIKLWTFSQS
jgi:hypothetical protein